MTPENSVNDGNPFLDLILMTYSEELSIEANSKEMAKKISSKESTLVALIEGLGPRLTSSNVQDRVKATDILAHVFTSLPKDFLSEKELEFIVEFLSNRLKDQHLVVPKAILCIYPVVQYQNLPKGAGSRLLQQVFQEANVQSHVHKIRWTVFRTIDFLMKRKLDELQEMSSDFVINFLQAIDGEKDPRNLLLLFQIIPRVITNFNLGPFVEDFFEVLSVYFPIDFSPSVTIGGDVVTREMLVEALHDSLSHTNNFSPFLIPLALEKLDSSLANAKIDSLRLLELCCEKCYQPDNLQPFLPALWHSLRKEIFMGGNELVEKHCISFLQSAFKVVSQDEGVLNTCIELIFTECKHHLCEPELRLIQPTSRILVAMCNASDKSCRAVVPKVLEVLHDQLIKKTVQGERKRIMEIVELILTSCRQYPEVTLTSLIDKWDEILATWFSFLTNNDPEFGNLSLRILLKVLENEADFPQKQRHLLQEHLLALLDKDGLRETSLATVIKIAEQLVSKHGDEFAQTSVPKLLKTVTSSEPDSESNESNNSIKTWGQVCGKVLSECSPFNESVCEKVVSHLLSELNPAAVNLKVLQCLNRILEKVNELKEASLMSLLVEKQLVFDKVFEIALLTGSNSGEGDPRSCMVPMNVCDGDADISTNSNSHLNVFDISVNILRNVVRGSTENVQKLLVDRFWEKRVGESPWESCMPHFPFAVVESILGPLRSCVKVHRQIEFADYLLQHSIRGTGTNIESFEVMYQRLLAIFLNKLECESDFLQLLNRIEKEIGNALGSQNLISETTEDARMNVDSQENSNSAHTILPGYETTAESATRLLAWVTKGLAMRGIKDLNIWVEKLISLLSTETVGNVAAAGFNTLLSDDEVSLNPQSHCKFRFLYKQRLFQMSVPKLVVGYRAAKSNSTKANFIKALSSQLKHIPNEILAMEIDNVFPLLVASIKLDSSGPVVLSTLKAFTEMMQNMEEETEKKLVEYCYDIVPQLVKLAEFRGNMDVRIMALQCLQKCAKCPSHVILPLRKKVVDDLLLCLDDHKRLVRKEARLARSTWILIGSPGGL